MSKENDGGPAYPAKRFERIENGKFSTSADVDYSGMSLRDYFAGQSLVGLLSNEALLKQLFGQGRLRGVDTDDAVAQFCYQQSDAMLKEREK